MFSYFTSVSYTHLRAHETDSYLVCRLLLEKKKGTRRPREWFTSSIVGQCSCQVLSCVVVVWRTHRGGLVPRVYTERSDRPWVTLSLCVMIMRRYILGEGGLVPTHTASSYRISTDQVLEPCYSTWPLPGMTDTLVPQAASVSSACIS